MKLLLLALMLMSCKPSQGNSSKNHHPLRMHCVMVGSNLRTAGTFFKCENAEVICYKNMIDGGGLSCKWKKIWDWQKEKK